jgi:pimeloyl-ACP methyl ester carboxylesterase
MIDLGGRRVHIWLAGTGSPAVVVVPCLGGTGAAWTPILAELAATTTVCLVDRGGIGWSDAAPWPRTGTAITEELHRLLQVGGIPKPVILVGHSTGGLISRAYAARYSDDVAGIVLVDATPAERDPDVFNGRREIWAANLRVVLGLLRPAGMYRAATALGLVDGGRTYKQQFLPPEEVDAAVANGLARRVRGGSQEMLAFPALQAQVRAEAHYLGPRPLTVLVGGPEGREDWHPAWVKLQRAHCGLSSASKYIYAPDAGHHVHHDDPALVASEIRDLVERVRSHADVEDQFQEGASSSSHSTSRSS